MTTAPSLSEPLLTVKLAAVLLVLSTKSVYRMASRGELPCYLLRGAGRKTTVRFSRTELERWLGERRVLPAGVRTLTDPSRRRR